MKPDKPALKVNQMQQFLQQAQALQPSLKAEGFEGVDGAELVGLVRSLRKAIAEMDAGKGIPLETLKAELDERYGGQSEQKS